MFELGGDPVPGPLNMLQILYRLCELDETVAEVKSESYVRELTPSDVLWFNVALKAMDLKMGGQDEEVGEKFLDGVPYPLKRNPEAEKIPPHFLCLLKRIESFKREVEELGVEVKVTVNIGEK